MAEVIPLRSERGEHRAALREEEWAFSFAEYFHSVRAVVGTFLASEYVHIIAVDYIKDMDPTDTATYIFSLQPMMEELHNGR